MRKSKEEKILEYSDKMMKELYQVYGEGISSNEYKKLLKEYNKLLNRYGKIIKFSDNIGNSIIQENDVLNNNINYAINKARDKLLENVTEHRKTKEAYNDYTIKIKQLTEALNETYTINSSIQKKLDNYIKRYGEINHSFNEELKTKDLFLFSETINPIEYRNLDIKKIISLELSKEKNITLSKIKLINFQNKKEFIERNTSVHNFLKGTYKYIKNNLSKDDIVYHYNQEVFYVILKNRDINEAKDLISQLNIKRKVFDFEIKFSMGMTKFKENIDTEEIFINRCEDAFNQSTTNSNIIII